MRSRRLGNPLSLLLIDVDHFKLYNDHYGHPRGDACLQEVVRAVQGAVRRTGDLVARCGGEEFAVLLPETSRIGGEFVAQRVLGAVAACKIRHEGSLTAHHVSVSIGIGCYDETSSSWETADLAGEDRDELHSRFTAGDLMATADRALYRAKHAGRAQVHMLDMGDLAAPNPMVSAEPERMRGAERA